MRPRVALALAALAAVSAAPALADFASDEPANYNKTNERYELQTSTPEFQALLREKSAQSPGEVAAIAASDPERNPFQNLCHQHTDGCAGDVRLYDWDKRPGNVRWPVLWTARSGATISGHVWAVAGGPARKPGAVITNGSVQAPEQLYWVQAAALARAGYVVLTWDPQTQGRSDGPGGPGTESENRSPQTPEAFTEGTVDALDFFLSTPARPFRPRNSRTVPSVNHSAKQARRVREGRNAAFNPLHASLDPSRIGIAGHSLGAFAVSKVGVEDSRVDALVAWDQLSTSERSGSGGSGAPIKPRVPGLGFSGDYGIGSPNGSAGVNPRPRSSAPDPNGATGPSRDYSRAGVQTMQVNTRAGTHFEPGFIPNAAFPATLRGIDLTTWYTIAWFEKYVRRSLAADRFLLTGRWQRDPEDLRVDPPGKGNLFSPTLRSRVDIRRSVGGRAHCEDLRGGCRVLVDDRAGPFSAFDFAYGRQSLRPVRPARCARAIRVPRRLDLSRSRRRLRVGLRLSDRVRARAGVRRRGARARSGRRLRTFKPGRRTLVVRLRRRARPGRHRLRLRLRCTSGVQRTSARVRVVR